MLRTVEKHIILPAKPERVLRSFIDSADLRGWWKVSRSLVQEEQGGTWCIVWDDYGQAGTQHAWVGAIEKIDSRHLHVRNLVMIEPGRPLFGPLELELIAVPKDNGSSLHVYHRGYQSGEHWDWLHDAVVQGWDHVLADLVGWLAQGQQ